MRGRLLFLTLFGAGVVCASWAVMRAPGAPRPDIAKPSVDLGIYGHVVHVGWVVKDLDRVVDFWEKLGVKDIQRRGVVNTPEVVYRGRTFVAKIKRATARVGGAEIEWIQPVSGVSTFSDFLRRHGDGIHHLAFRVPNAGQFDEQVKYFAGHGVGTVETGSWAGKNGTGRFVYLDTASRGGGITLELFYDPDAPRPAETRRANEYPFTQIVQYAMVVRDLAKVNEFYKGLGFGDMGSDRFVGLDRVYHGAPSKYEMDLGWWRWGDVPFEWIQSQVRPNVYSDYLKAHGEGLHHLAVNVRDLDQAIALFRAKGVTVAQSGAWDIRGSRGRFAYIDTDPYGGVTIELLWNEPPK
jgi:catechol 2,3-dioxygenase-like lactoylglutathione lyase family enzyme